MKASRHVSAKAARYPVGRDEVQAFKRGGKRMTTEPACASEAAIAPGETSNCDLREAFRRRDTYRASLDTSLKEQEDLIAKKTRFTNASAASKLRKIYALVDELGDAAKDFVACKNGCAACCNMNVTISAIEAKQIQAMTGARSIALSSSRTHDPAEFSGQPCPFLRDSRCSIYETRPFACRKHVSFDTTSYWCQPERSHEIQLPMIRFDGAEEAFFEVTGRNNSGVFGDIRDFFPGPYIKS
jgi:Fe-S-cluster containining protein